MPPPPPTVEGEEGGGRASAGGCGANAGFRAGCEVGFAGGGAVERGSALAVVAAVAGAVGVVAVGLCGSAVEWTRLWLLLPLELDSDADGRAHGRAALVTVQHSNAARRRTRSRGGAEVVVERLTSLWPSIGPWPLQLGGLLLFRMFCFQSFFVTGTWQRAIGRGRFVFWRFPLRFLRVEGFVG
jgi:hypothetical protein